MASTKSPKYRHREAWHPEEVLVGHLVSKNLAQGRSERKQVTSWNLFLSPFLVLGQWEDFRILGRRMTFPERLYFWKKKQLTFLMTMILG